MQDSANEEQGLAAPQSDQQQQQQANRGRGRGRGARGRGAATGRQAVNPTVPHVITRLVAGTQPIVRPEHSYYVINLVNIASLFAGFAGFIVRLARRNDWPLGAGYYQGLMLYALAAKLQRVGIASNQISPPSNEMIQVTGLELPTSIVTLIDQFGMKTDVAGVAIAPLVTNELVRTIGRMAFLVANIGCDHSRVNANSALWVDANKFNLMQQAYGNMMYARICLATVAGRLGVSCSLSGTRMLDLNRASYQMAIEYAVNQAGIAAAMPNGAEILQILPNNANNAGFFLAPFTTGGPALVAGGNLGANLCAGFNDVRASHPNGANIFANNDGYVDGTSITYVPGGWDDYYAEQVELAHRFFMSPVSVSPAGSFAPTVVSGGEDQMSGYSVVAGLTAMEWNLGLVLGTDPIFCTRDGFPFNVSDRVRRRTRFSVPPIELSYDNLTAAFIRESLRPTKS